jgi:hypothetical protein
VSESTLPSDDAAFWRSCCERGITICRARMPKREETECWVVEKHETFRDRKEWVATHTFESLEAVYQEIGRYLATGIEPGLH